MVRTVKYLFGLLEFVSPKLILGSHTRMLRGVREFLGARSESEKVGEDLLHYLNIAALMLRSPSPPYIHGFLIHLPEGQEGVEGVVGGDGFTVQGVCVPQLRVRAPGMYSRFAPDLLGLGAMGEVEVNDAGRYTHHQHVRNWEWHVIPCAQLVQQWYSHIIRLLLCALQWTVQPLHNDEPHIS